MASTGILICTSALSFAARPMQTSPEPPAAAKASTLSVEDLARDKRWREVVYAANKMTMTDPDAPTGFYWLGAARLQLHDAAGAIQALRAAQKRGFDTALLHEDLGLAYYDLNQFLLFEQEMAKVMQHDPQDFRPSYYLGLYHLTIKSDPNGALAFFEQAIKLKPDDWKSLYEEGNCLEKLARPEEARKFYLRSIASVESSGQPFGWPYQGMARTLVGEDPQKALTFAKKAAEAEPLEYSNHMVLAQVLQSLKDYPEAIRETREAINENPTDAPSEYLLFLLYRQTGEKSSAETALKQFQELHAIYGSE